MFALKPRAVGTSTGVPLPKELLARLKVGEGETLFAVETPSGHVLWPYRPDVAEQIENGRQGMKEYRDTLRALAR